MAYIRFTSNHGAPALIVSDQGTQLVKAGRLVESDSSDLASWDWSKIVDTTAKSGTHWVFVQSGCQWRNGLVEHQVASVKRSMSKVLGAHQDLNYAELDTLFASTANIVNQRPLAVRTFSQDEIRSITPNDLLLGRNKLPVQPSEIYGENDNINLRLTYIRELEKLWWDEWLKQVFPSLVPYNKWRTEFRNPQVGDIVLVHYPSRASKGDYRLARISAVHPDPHGIVRTVTVIMRPRDKREKVTADPPHLKPKPPVELSLGIQRLAVILPVEEQLHLGEDPALTGDPSQGFHGFSSTEPKAAQHKAQVLAELVDKAAVPSEQPDPQHQAADDQGADQSGQTEPEVLPDPAAHDRHQGCAPNADAVLNASLSSEPDSFYGFDSEAVAVSKVKSEKYDRLKLDAEVFRDDMEENELSKRLLVLRE